MAGSCASTTPDPTSTAPAPAVGTAGLGPLAQLRARNSLIVAVRATDARSPKRMFESALATEIAKRIVGERATATFKESERPSTLVERGEADIALVASTEAPPAGVVLSDPYARDDAVAIREDSVSLQAAVDSVLNALVTSGEIRLMATAVGFRYEAP